MKKGLQWYQMVFHTLTKKLEAYPLDSLENYNANDQKPSILYVHSAFCGIF